mmetsp:Transcript_73799/g.225703  ORF Transcript_73799/g.225703 Transcript_73799/m.225703 type:complete len:285 (+) Transcript_73799:1882-2736(+)
MRMPWSLQAGGRSALSCCMLMDCAPSRSAAANRASRDLASLVNNDSRNLRHSSSGQSGPMSQAPEASSNSSQSSRGRSNFNSGVHSRLFSLYVTIGDVKSSTHVSRIFFMSACIRNCKAPTNLADGKLEWYKRCSCEVPNTMSMSLRESAFPAMLGDGTLGTKWYSVGTEVTAFPLPALGATFWPKSALTSELLPVPVAPITQTRNWTLSNFSKLSATPDTLPRKLCNKRAQLPLSPTSATSPTPWPTNSRSSFSTPAASVLLALFGSTTKSCTNCKLHLAITL